MALDPDAICSGPEGQACGAKRGREQRGGEKQRGETRMGWVAAAMNERAKQGVSGEGGHGSDRLLRSANLRHSSMAETSG